VPGTAGQVRLDVLGPVRVFEDDQPAAVRLSPAQRVADRAQGPVDVTGLGQLELGGEPDQRGAHAGGLLGRNPPHQVVGVGVPVGILDGELGAPGPAELLLGGGQQRDGAVAEQLPHIGEQAFTPDEARIARRQPTPDRHAASHP
jgi:hypothetical protein